MFTCAATWMMCTRSAVPRRETPTDRQSENREGGRNQGSETRSLHTRCQLCLCRVGLWFGWLAAAGCLNCTVQTPPRHFGNVPGCDSRTATGAVLRSLDKYMLLWVVGPRHNVRHIFPNGIKSSTQLSSSCLCLRARSGPYPSGTFNKYMRETRARHSATGKKTALIHWRWKR